MGLIRLPINQGMVKAVDEVGLSNYGAAMVDVYVDELGNINRRPGLVELCDLGTSAAVDGLFWWDEEQKVIAVSNGSTFEVTDSSGTIGMFTGDSFSVGTRVTFADFGTALYAANGGAIKAISTSDTVTDMADVDAPTAVTHVAVMDRYLIANESGTGNFHWSDVNAPTDWSGYYAEAEGRPDDILALDAKNLELSFLGSKTLEIWDNDGVTPFIRLQQGFVQSGTVAKYSFTWCNGPQTFLWLDESRRVVELRGRTAVPISLSMNSYIQGFTSVSDAIGDYVEVSGRPSYVIQFPTEGKCLVWVFVASNWYEWGNWNSTTATYDRFRGNCYCLAPTWNLTLVGDRANGKIYKFSNTTYEDNSSTLRSVVRTAHYNHNTEVKRKFCNGIYCRLKRTNVVSVDDTPDLMVKYRNNGSSTWSNEQSITLQQVGDTEFRGKLSRLGSYYSRQWEFSLTDAYPLCLVSVEEDVEMER